MLLLPAGPSEPRVEAVGRELVQTLTPSGGSFERQAVSAGWPAGVVLSGPDAGARQGLLVLPGLTLEAAGIDGATIEPDLPDDLLGRVDLDDYLPLRAGRERIAAIEPMDAGRPAGEAADSPHLFAPAVELDNRLVLKQADEAMAIGQP